MDKHIADPIVTKEKKHENTNEIEKWLNQIKQDNRYHEQYQILTEWIGNNKFEKFEEIAVIYENEDVLSTKFDPKNENMVALAILALKLKKDHWNKQIQRLNRM